ncbi:phage protein Gp19/Gp15/Gp42 [Bifidobacterium margollesii]|uniref:Phage protein Gp19/Gp15/Gp42 n=1 Tax=Bifidobacterium margollesii TaxID=2020964 RepID=A0A2N5J7A7_9BIFI|nr:Gp19/Gp15/Gp42 family protein [Bifidobacterium margollesii]PLS30098.1 phage protein Gp19/Gp15/Gp42 [Bifidobacterium margollesii]
MADEETDPDADPGMGGDTTPLATHGDLERRWHALTDAERAQADELLADASEIVRAHVAAYSETHDPSWWASRRRRLNLICCQMVRTAMQQQVSGVPDGVTQSTETTGPFTSSYSWASPDGYLRWSDSYLRILGLGGQRAYSIGMDDGSVIG